MILENVGQDYIEAPLMTEREEENILYYMKQLGVNYHDLGKRELYLNKIIFFSTDKTK